MGGKKIRAAILPPVEEGGIFRIPSSTSGQREDCAALAAGRVQFRTNAPLCDIKSLIRMRGGCKQTDLTDPHTRDLIRTRGNIVPTEPELLGNLVAWRLGGKASGWLGSWVAGRLGG